MQVVRAAHGVTLAAVCCCKPRVGAPTRHLLVTAASDGTGAVVGPQLYELFRWLGCCKQDVKVFQKGNLG